MPLPGQGQQLHWGRDAAVRCCVDAVTPTVRPRELFTHKTWILALLPASYVQILFSRYSEYS